MRGGGYLCSMSSIRDSANFFYFHILFSFHNYLPKAFIYKVCRNKLWQRYSNQILLCTHLLEIVYYGRNPVYCSWSTNNPPPLFLIVIFCLFLSLFRLGLPRRVRKEVQLGPRRVRTPRRDQNQKKTKFKNKGGMGLFVLQVPNRGLHLRKINK